MADTAAPLDPAQPTLSFVILSWNEWPMLRQCLAGIYRGALPAFEVLVIDNGSADGTPDLVRTEFPSASLHCNGRNLGVSKARNCGFAQARGEFIVSLDADAELIGDCLGRLLAFLREHPGVDLVAPRTLNTDGSIQESARSFPSALSGLFGRQSTLTRWFPNNPASRRYLARQHLEATEPFEVEWVGGACMFFRRRLLAEVGVLDESYFHYWEDADWCRRVRAGGKRIFCVPAARIVHHETSHRGKRKRPGRVWMFHYNAYRLYTHWCTLGYWDPRSVLAGAALLGRTLLFIIYHSMPRFTAVGRERATRRPPSSLDRAAAVRRDRQPTGR